MERKVERNYFGSSISDNGTIIIDKNGMRVEGLENGYATKDDIIVALLIQAINSGSWQHSWHLDVRKAQIKNSDERKKVREIIEEKIEQAEQLKQMLKDAKQVLGRWHY